MVTQPTQHRWHFEHAGGVEQVLLECGDDLRALSSLDPKLWVALACPTTGLNLDAQTLALLDTDGDGCIRRPEVLAAVAWCCARLRDPGLILQPGTSLPLQALVDDEEGQRLREAARLVLQRLGRPEAEVLELADLQARERVFPPPLPNGDGVLPPALLRDQPDLQVWVERLLAAYGGQTDRSGATGIDAACVDAAEADVARWQAWLAAQPGGDPAVLEAAWQALQALADKVDDYFARCRWMAFEPRLIPTLDSPAAALQATLAVQPLAQVQPELAALPLALPTPEPILPLQPQRLNPAWAAAVNALVVQAVQPLLGPRTALTEADWQALRQSVQPWGDWLAARPTVPVATWPSAWLDDWIQANVAAQLRAAIAADRQAQAQADRIDALHRLLLWRRDLAQLLRNMVNFVDFYRDAQATFQIGTLYIDQRECRLCLPVVDAAAHAQLAGYSGLYLLYGRCERAGDAPMGIVAALTAGDAADFMVPGRHGLFVDRQGRDWLFTLQRVVENPISVREAFWLPYRRVGRLIGEQIRKFAATRDQAVQAQAAEVVTNGASQLESTSAKPATPQAFDIAKFAGIFAAIGLALGAMGTALAAVVTGFLQLAWWQMPLVILGLMLLISGPSMLLAALKLRQRNLGPLLDANGWAVNARARIGIPMGARLTAVAHRPGAARHRFSGAA